MTAEERIDRFFALLRPKLLELAEEGYEIRFEADDDGFLGTYTIAFILSAGTPTNPSGHTDPEEALEGFLDG